MTENILEVTDLQVFYPVSRKTPFEKKKSIQVLKDVSFAMKRGEILGLVGESGSGKTTLARSILQMIPYEGTIIRNTMQPQMVFQDPYGSLNPSKRIAWILEEPLRLKGGLSKEERVLKVKTMLERVGLEEKILEHYPRELSGGQRERIAIAAALMLEPELLIADEPVSALDVTIQAQILALLKEIQKEIRGRKIAMVFQDPMTSLDPTMTIGKQIMEPMMYHYGTSKEEAYKKAVELLEEVGITNAEKRMKNYPHQLSGGMRQRVVIAIALSCDPYVLICDEPTTALDVTIQAKILELIQDLQKKKGISVIYITHDLGVVAKVADFVNVMYAGKIVETGSIEDIFYRPLHPYTWGLLSAMPDLNTDDPELYTIPGSPPNVTKEIKGDAFAPRNKYALNIDKRIEPPMFKVEGSTTHKVASWLMHPNAPKVEMPEALRKRIDNMMKEGVPNNGQE